MQQSSSHTYRSIQTLRPGEQNVYVMGVISDFIPPTLSKGSDFYCRIRIVDQSSTDMTCLLFNASPERLPQESQCAIGDVLCLRSVKTRPFKDHTQCILFPDSPGMWVILSRPDPDPGGREDRGKGRFTITVAPGRSHTISTEEERIANELLEWMDGTGGAQTSGERVATVSSPASSTVPVSLSDVRVRMDQNLTVCGVVLHLKPPTKSKAKTGGYFTSLVVIDTTRSRDGFTMVLFGSSEDKLPRVYSKGDVVLVRGLKIEVYQDSLKGRGVPGFHTAVAFSGHPEAPLKPRGGKGRETSLSGEEAQRVRELKVWALQQPGVRLEERNQQLKDIALEDETYDITCQVVATAFSESRNRAILTVWDGTKTTLPCAKAGELDTTFETRISHNLAESAGDLAREVVIYAADKIRAQPGDFVRLIHVTFEPTTVGSGPSNDPPSVQLYVTKESYIGGGVIVLAPDDPEVKDLKKLLPAAKLDYQLSRFRKLKRPVPASVTTVFEPNKKLRASVSAIRECTEVPKLFFGEVRVLKVTPDRVDQLCKLRCPFCHRHFAHEQFDSPCPTCTTEHPGETPSKLRYIYSFTLKVQDRSGCLDVNVSSMNAETFLPQLPPTDLGSSREAGEAMVDRLYYLCGGNNPFIDPEPGVDWPRPWMECGITSYRSGSDQLCYAMFDTELHEWDL